VFFDRSSKDVVYLQNTRLQLATLFELDETTIEMSLKKGAQVPLRSHQVISQPAANTVLRRSLAID
jgi:hypothetical protein